MSMLIRQKTKVISFRQSWMSQGRILAFLSGTWPKAPSLPWLGQAIRDALQLVPMLAVLIGLAALVGGGVGGIPRDSKAIGHVLFSKPHPTATPTSTPPASTSSELALTNTPLVTTAPFASSRHMPAPKNASLPSGAAPDIQPTLPLRAVFYYPWFPEAWTQQGIYPYTYYHPSPGYYDSSDQIVIRQQIAAMQYGGIAAGIMSWWGQGTRTDQSILTILSATAGSTFRWSLYYEPEGQGDPTVSQITADLIYLLDHYGNDPSYLRIGGRFVVFVYADATDGCGMADRWKQANTVNAYIVLKVFAGYRTCASQLDSWHQYGPAVAADSQGSYSYSISPGFWKVGESPRLTRDLTRWNTNIRDMIASGAMFQLITTFNEWGEGTVVESASEWGSTSGYGAYLDALHNNGGGQQVGPSPTATPSPTSTATPLSTVSFVAEADAQVQELNPNTNYGTSNYLQVDGASDPDMESYIRFTVGGVTGAVQSARLRVYDTTNGSANGPAVYGTGNTWTETGITWNTRPARIGDATDNKGAITTATWVEYNVTPLVTGNGTYSFVLVADSNDAVIFSSREGSAPPQLVLTMAPTTTPTVTQVPGLTATRTPTPTGSDPVLVGAGDIADCSSTGDEATANLLDGIPGTVFTAGDHAYPDGTSTDFTNCYNPTWGRHKARTRPSAGNHDYNTPGAAGYFGYFGLAAGDPTKGYYSYDLGAWHIIAINSNCSAVGSCGAGSPQEQWLRADLAAHPAVCTLAYWHHPRFSSGLHGSTTSMQSIWQALYDYNADVVVSGHDHDYERFAPQDPNGVADPARGIREFVVGSGGKNHYAFPGAPIANSEVRNDDTFGVLKLTLHATSYNWEFIPQAGKTFTDSGTTSCH